MSIYKMSVFCVSLCIATAAHAGLVWQQVSNGPCPGQVVVDHTNDDVDGYIIPSVNTRDEGHHQDHNYGQDYNLQEHVRYDDGQMSDDDLANWTDHLAK